MDQKKNIDLGSIQIHKKVLAEIIETAIKDVDGVALVNKKTAQKLSHLLGKESFAGIDISVVDKDQVDVSVHVTVRYGLNIPELAVKIQDVIKKAISTTVNINLKDVNVHIEGIERG